MNIFKSWTINTAILIAIMSIVIENMETLRPYFGEYGPLAGVAAAAIMAALRVKTDKPLKDK
jgi:hypothetical protein